jgi:hypothetical protein
MQYLCKLASFAIFCFGSVVVVLLFANVSDQPVAARLQLNGTDYGLSSKLVKVTSVSLSGKSKSFESPTAVQRDLTFPPRTVLALELSDLKQ